MMNKKLIDDFCRENRMHYQDIDFMDCCIAFISEMEIGLSGRGGSLGMIPTYLFDSENKPCGQTAIALDAGGTNLRISAVSFDDGGNPEIVYFKQMPVPGAECEVTKEEFFDTISEALSPVLPMSDKIGFCFSYPAEMYPGGDGRLIRWTKGIFAKDVEGSLICESLIEAMKKKGTYSGQKIVLLNDTAAVLLAGRSAARGEIYSDHIGFILGTGTNTAYWEEMNNIRKLRKSGTSGRIIINIESGGFGKAQGGYFDAVLDAESENPGLQRFEKMVSGAYQGRLAEIIIKSTVENNILNMLSGTNILSGLSTKDVHDFINNPCGENLLTGLFPAGDEREKVFYLLELMIGRAAKLAAVNLTSIMLKTGAGRNPCRPVCIISEGTTLYSSPFFRRRLNYFMEKYAKEKLNLYCDIIRAERLTIIGTAISALL